LNTRASTRNILLIRLEPQIPPPPFAHQDGFTISPTNSHIPLGRQATKSRLILTRSHVQSPATSVG
jgi:membrane glycosyltransferase